ncbi:hypothetical protein DFH09DRAFT_1145100 [Mycena vulgaris]|nr:hypothetical protein DFH09DRAFT_1145100 [Mycena vulgaris]
MPELPIELERDIFESTARAWRMDPRLRLNLMLVARRVHTWVEPIIQEITILSGNHAPATVRFLNLIDSKPAHFFRNVKALCLVYDIDRTKAARVLVVCTETRRLACWVDFDRAPRLPALIAVLPLRHLSIEFRHFVWLLEHHSRSPWLEHLTHLDLIFWNLLSPTSFPSLASLPSLTHVSVPLSRAMTPGAITTTLATCRILQVLVILSPYNDDPMFHAIGADQDRRVVIQHGLVSAKDWLSSADGVADYWFRAEEVIAGRAAVTS